MTKLENPELMPGKFSSGSSTGLGKPEQMPKLGKPELMLDKFSSGSSTKFGKPER